MNDDTRRRELAANPFRTKDLVRLRSGGPIMTVSDPHGISGVVCTWHESGEVKHGSFSSDVLKAAQPAKPVRYVVRKSLRRGG